MGPKTFYNYLCQQVSKILKLLNASVDLAFADSWENMGSSAETPASVNDSSVQHVNGLSVYQEGRGPNGEQGAFMVSAVVSATPREVFSVSICQLLSYSGL